MLAVQNLGVGLANKGRLTRASCAAVKAVRGDAAAVGFAAPGARPLESSRLFSAG